MNRDGVTDIVVKVTTDDGLVGWRESCSGAIAPFALYLASDESAVVTGGIFPIDSGYMAFKANVGLMGVVSGQAT